MTDHERFGVVILNWNSAQDTLDCLQSFLDREPSAVAIVVDNGSEDDSVARIAAWCAARGSSQVSIDAARVDGLTDAACARVVLVRSPENLGFARGCNLGLRAVVALRLPFAIFLNNDTLVHDGALSFLVERLTAERDLFAAVPLIRVAATGRIWNCGGTISRMGFRRYHLAGASAQTAGLPERLECSFFTGCCFAVRTEEFARRGGFTERFFFGEEDFELGLWMLDHARRAACFTGAVIDHKVSAAIERANPAAAAKAYVYYLNRFIHMRLRLGTLAWAAWLAAYVPYIVQLLYRTSAVSARELPRFMRALVRDARRHDQVGRELFMQVMKAKPW